MSTSTRNITPMRTSGTQFLIERTNRESGDYQWVRETLVNAIEAKATRVEFGIEWQGVATKGVYRRTISDNGAGMNPEQLVQFFNTYGGGAKKIGGVHENFGVGAKTSLLPWNRCGVVVISWQGGKPAMIWMLRDPTTGEYGLRVLNATQRGRTVLDTVFTPYDDPEWGVDWRKVKPPWITDHGTVIVLLGKAPTQDTVLGDPYRNETSIKGISSYLNHRMWDVRSTGAKVYVAELRSQDKRQWPRGPDEVGSRRINLREIHGAHFWIEYPPQAAGKLAAKGTVAYPKDGAAIDWYLWRGPRPAVDAYAPEQGFIGVLYKNELYDFTTHHATYRSFGITERSVRTCLWIVVRPSMVDPTKGGVYPRTDRNALLYKPRGVGNAARPVPMLDWAAWFAENMPAEVMDAIRAARGEDSGTIRDRAWKDRLAERFGSRWRITKLREAVAGLAVVQPDQTGSSPLRAVLDRGAGVEARGRDAPVIESGRHGVPNTGSVAGTLAANATKVAGDLPDYRWEKGSEFDVGILAMWNPPSTMAPTGEVVLNMDHAVVTMVVDYWQDRYPEHLADEVREAVFDVYGEVGVAKVAHSEHLKGIIPADTIEHDLRAPTALTMALLGLMAEESLLSRRLDTQFRRKEVAR